MIHNHACPSCSTTTPCQGRYAHAKACSSCSQASPAARTTFGVGR